MPKIGDFKLGAELNQRGWRYIWSACESCGKERWVQYKRKDERSSGVMEGLSSEHIEAKLNKSEER